MSRLVLLWAVLAFLAPSAFGQSVYKQPCVNQVGYQDFTSVAVDFTGIKYGSLQFVWTGLTGTVNGTAKLQVSDNSGTNWQDKTGTVYSLAGTAGNAVISMTNITEQFYRVVYLHSGITGGTINCYLLGKP